MHHTRILTPFSYILSLAVFLLVPLSACSEPVAPATLTIAPPPNSVAASIELFLDDQKIKTFSADDLSNLAHPLAADKARFTGQSYVLLNDVLKAAGIVDAQKIAVIGGAGEVIYFDWKDISAGTTKLVLIGRHGDSWKLVQTSGPLESLDPQGFVVRVVTRVVIISTKLGSALPDSVAVNKSRACANSKVYTTVADALNDFAQVCILNLDGQSLTQLAPEIFTLPNLTTLDLGHNHLASLPPDIGRLRSLTTLSLESNALTELPSELGQLTQLQSLRVGRNQLARLPIEIRNLKNLTLLEMDNNALTQLPDALSEMVSLTDLEVANNKLTQLPSALGGLKHLQKLDLSGNNFSPDEKQKIKTLFPNAAIEW